MHIEISRCQRKLPFLFVLLFFLFALSGNTVATTVLSVDMDKIITESEFVFEGEVLGAEAKLSPENNWIYTYITFAVVDVVKGDYDGKQITLRFTGGTVGEYTFKAHGMVMPKVGERGIYFVESLSRTQVNPLYGWSQGHFLVIHDKDGIERIRTSNHQAVRSLQLNMNDNAREFSGGVARGIDAVSATSNNPGMTKLEFVESLRARGSSK